MTGEALPPIGPIGVLLIEDTPADAEMLLRELRRGGLDVQPQRVDSRDGLLQAIAGSSPDVILSDYSLPGFGGMTGLALAREHWPDTPFIFVSGTIGEERAIAALREGATDYVLKDQRARLVPAVRRAVHEARERGARRAAEQAQRISEERFRSIAEATQDWIWEIDAGGSYGYCSAAAEAILGWRPDELIGRNALQQVHPHSRDRFAGLMRAAAAESRGWRELNLRLVCKDGSTRWVECNALPLLDGAGALTGWRGVARDISERIEHEDRIKRLSRIHAVTSSINATIVRVRDRDELFREACRIAVEEGGFSLAWVGVANVSAHASPVARFGTDDGFLDEARRLIGPDGHATPAMTALREGRPIVVNDIAAESAYAPRAPALARNFRSLAALPLLVDGKAVAVQMLYAPEPQFFDHDEVKLLKGLAADLSFALEHIAKAESLAYVSHHDTLTGLPNQVLFVERLTQLIRGGGGVLDADHRLAVILIDLQRLREVNETLGRGAGDRFVREFAERLSRMFGGGQLPARISGSAFAVAIDRVRGPALALHIESWLLRALGEPFDVDGVELHAAVKIGIAFHPVDADNADSLLLNAEAALQRARDTGDVYAFYAPEMNARVSQRLHLESRLRKAVQERQFVLHYQPKVELATRRIVGLEALIRWRDPERGLVSPLEFIPLLEESGLIVEVGRWVIEQAVRDAAHWQAAGLAVPRIAVNVSQAQLRHKDFVASVLAARGSHTGIDLEITESLVALDSEGSFAKLRELRTAGVHVHMDDFGTGYSSLSQIARLPLDALKIDRAFVADMAERSEHMAIVSTIVNLARTLRLAVVAEGVETQQQATLLAGLGCEQAQGWLYSRPLPSDELAQLLAAGV